MSEPKGIKDEDYPPIPEVIKTVSYLATFIVAIFTGRQFLPLELQFALAAIFATSSVLFVLWIWRRPFRRYWKTMKRNEIAGTHYSQLVRYCERLREFVSPGSRNNPNFFLRDLKGRVKDFNSLSMPESSYSAMMVWDLEKALKANKQNLQNFVWGADSLCSLVQFFNEAYVLNPSKEVRAIIKNAQQSGELPPDDLPEIPEDLLEGYNTVRETFAAFLREFAEFISGVNKQFGQDRRRAGDTWYDADLMRGTQFEPPKELENPPVGY